jgi:hypothetical protein
MNFREHYVNAHKKWFAKEYPQAWKDGFYSPPKFPNINKANGLTQWVLNFVNWNGYRATRISSAGRYIPGNTYEGGMFIPGSTRKGTADISCTIKGLALMVEIKTGRDKPSPEQLKEQAKEIAAGGRYEFVSHPDDFIKIYNQLL